MRKYFIGVFGAVFLALLSTSAWAPFGGGGGVTTPLRLGRGTAGAPAYSFALATNTGMYITGGNDLTFMVPSGQALACTNDLISCSMGAGIFFLNNALEFSRDATGVLGIYDSASFTAQRWYKADSTGYISLRSATPTIGACGTSPSVSGSDSAMVVTVGTGGVATTCAVTFNNTTTPWTTAPVCIAQSDNTADAALAITTSITAVTVTKAAALTASSHLNIVCIGMKP